MSVPSIFYDFKKIIPLKELTLGRLHCTVFAEKFGFIVKCAIV